MHSALKPLAAAVLLGCTTAVSAADSGPFSQFIQDALALCRFHSFQLSHEIVMFSRTFYRELILDLRG